MSERALARSLRGYYASAAAMDGGFFLIMTAMPFKVLALGGGAVHLGLVPALGAVAYIPFAPLAGHASDRVGRTGLCLAGGALLVLCAALAYRTASLSSLLLLQLLMGLGKALYWPVVQSALADLTPPPQRVRVLNRFNVAWSGGKTLGFLLGGLLLARYGFHAVFLCGSAAVVAAVVALPKRGAPAVAPPDDGGPRPLAPPGRPDARVRALRAQGWLANLAAYGMIGILTHHLPQWFAARGWSEARYGVFLAAIFVSQTVVFLLLTGPLRFPRSPRGLWGPQLASVAAVAAIPALGAFPVLMLVVPVLGLGCGMAYAASLHYSLASAQSRGRNAGIHEALIGAGGFLPPLLAGIAVAGTGRLGAPYALAAALLAVAVAAEVALWRRSGRARGETED